MAPKLGEWKITFLEANMNWLADQSVGSSVKREKRDWQLLFLLIPNFL